MGWTLRKKILGGYGVCLALTLVVIVWAIADLLRLGQASDAILSENYKSILAAENMIDSIERQDSAILLLLLDFNQEGVGQFRQNESHFLQWLGRAKDNITIQGEREVVDRIDKGYASYLAHFSRLETISVDSSQNGLTYYHETVLPNFTAVRDACVNLREINSDTMFKVSARANRIARQATLSTAVIGLAAIAIGLGFSLLLSSIIVKPLKSIMAAAQKLAEGSYETQVKTGSTDELGHLAAEFNSMTRKLKAYHDLNIGEIVTEKRKNAAIIRSIEDGIIVVDAELKVTNINPAASKTLGADIEKAQNRHFLEVVHNEQLFEQIRECIESGRSPNIQEGLNILPIQGPESRRYFQFSITPVHVGVDVTTGVVLVLRDVTRLKELDRLKTEFVMAASHELRTPLTSMGMSIDLLLEKAGPRLDSKEQQLLSVAHEELERLKALVSNLLDLSRIEAGKMEMEFERVSPRLLCEQVVTVMKVQAEEKGVELTVQPAEGIPDVRADANKITWVLINLVSNALRYTGAAGHVRLTAEQVGSQVHLSVRDSGTGIPYEFQTKIFDKFVQLKSDKTAGGSGLGLAISKEIVRAHGGSIWVESAPGQGSTFTFTLPVAQTN